MVYCKDCQFYKSQRIWEIRVNLRFIDPTEDGPLPGVRSGGMMCYHPICFIYKQKESIEDGKYIVKERIKGQAQLNKNFNCRYFKPKPSYLIKKWFKTNFLSHIRRKNENF